MDVNYVCGFNNSWLKQIYDECMLQISVTWIIISVAALGQLLVMINSNDSFIFENGGATLGNSASPRRLWRRAPQGIF